MPADGLEGRELNDAVPVFVVEVIEAPFGQRADDRRDRAFELTQRRFDVLRVVAKLVFFPGKISRLDPVEADF